MPKLVSQRGGQGKSGLPENRLVTNPKRDNKIERGAMVQAQSAKINRGKISNNSSDGGPSKGKKIR